ncbi:spermidine/putrescine ABC transporter ATP-binding protein, partial [Pseudomonas sp. MWU13-2625]
QYQVSLGDGTRLTVRTPNSLEHHPRLSVGSSAGLLFERGSASVLLD